MSNRFELLSPAGDMERLRMALLYGADAVYLAGRRFGMRAAAVNFGDEELRRAVALVHGRGAKIYVTCNTLPREDELRELPAYLEFLQDAGVDALIIADLGVLALARRHAPRVARHVSTQFGVINSAAANALYALGRILWFWPGKRRWRISERSGPTPRRSCGWRPLSTGPCVCLFPAAVCSPII